MPKVEVGGQKNANESAERESEKLDYDPEVAAELETLNQGIESREEWLAGLGRVARREMLVGDEEKKEIYARKELGRLDLEGNPDAKNFEPAKKRNIFSRFFFKEPKHNIEGNDGVMVDTRKLKPEAAEKGTALSASELVEVKEKFDLTPEEVKDGKLSIEYVQGKNAVERLVKRAATPEEADKTAAEILERQLKEQEKKGQTLAKEKSSLEAFEKEQASINDMLTDDDRLIYERKKQDLENGMQDQRETIDSYKEKNLPDLKDFRAKTEASLEYSLGDLEEVTARESAFGAQIEGIKTKINRMKGAKQMAELFGNKIAAWEEEKAQAEVNKRGFTEAKKKINETISRLRKNLLEVERTLNRMEEIGKTPAELKQLREARSQKKQAEKQQRDAMEATKKQSASPAPESAPELEGEKVEIKFSGKNVSQESPEPNTDDTTDDDWAKEMKERAIAEAHDREALDKEEPPEVEKVVKPVDKKVVTDAPVAAPEPEAERTEKRETDIVRPVRFWLNALFGGKILPEREKILMKNFKVKDEKGLDRKITAEQAQKFCAFFTIELIRLKLLEPGDAWDQAAKAIGEVVKNIDYYDSREEKADGRTLAVDHDLTDEEAAEHLAYQKEVDRNDQAINETSEPFESLAKSVEPGAETAREEQEPVDQEYENLVAADRKNIRTEQQRSDLEKLREIKKGRFRPRGGMREPKGKFSVAEAPAVESIESKIKTAENVKAEQNETAVTRPVKFWLNAIYGGKLNPHDEKIMVTYFKLGGKFDKFADMTERQAERAFKGFLMGAEGFLPRDAREEARKKIDYIVEHIADYDREEEEAAGRAPAKKAFVKPAPVPRDVLEELGEKFDAGMAEDRKSVEPLAPRSEPIERSAGVVEPDKKRRKSTDKGKENKDARSGSGKRLKQRELAEEETRQAVREALEEDEPSQTIEKAEEISGPLDEKKPEPASDINNDLGQALKEAGLETSGAEPVSERVETEAEKAIKTLVEAVRVHLQEVSSGGNPVRKVKRAIEQNLGSIKKPKEIATEAELTEAVASYIKAMGGENGGVAKLAAEQMIRDIKAKL